MSLIQSSAINCVLGLSMGWLAPLSSVHAVEVWTGLTYSFSKPAFADPADPVHQDKITSNVAIARGFTRGIFNAASELGYQDDYSPASTLWATELNNSSLDVTEIVATNWENLIFEDWRTAYGGERAAGNNLVDKAAVIHLTTDDIYIEVRFTGWGIGVGGGGYFSYWRAEPPHTSPAGDYNRDLRVNAADYTVWRDMLGQYVSAGTSADGSGPDGSPDGVIDDHDYEFWKERFRNAVTSAGVGESGATYPLHVPEPSSFALTLVGVWLFSRSWLRQRARHAAVVVRR